MILLMTFIIHRETAERILCLVHFPPYTRDRLCKSYVGGNSGLKFYFLFWFEYFSMSVCETKSAHSSESVCETKSADSSEVSDQTFSISSTSRWENCFEFCVNPGLGLPGFE